MPYTLAEAAQACGMDKSTIRRAVKSGRISGTRNDFGVWLVEPAELHRIFPAVTKAEADTAATPRQAAATDELVAELRAVIADLRRDRDEWRDQAQRLALPKPAAAAAAPRSLWRWLRTTA